MDKEKVITAVEQTIKRVCADIKKKKGAVGCDKLDSFSKLVNSYTKLVEQHEQKDEEDDGRKEYLKYMSGNSS